MRNLPISAFLAAVVVLLGLASFVQGDAAVTKLLDKLFEGYDRRLRPNYGGKALVVECSAYVLDVFDIDESKHEYSVNMYLRHHWNDPRLRYEPPIPGMEFVMLDAEHATQLWAPDTFIVNERKVVRHGVKTLQELTRIKPGGDILQSYRITATASCKMNLGYFPFDRQLCSLDIESYGSTADEFYYSWKANAGVSQTSSSLKFRITGVNTVRNFQVVGSGNYSRLGLEFFFVRNSSRHLLDIYFPVLAMTLIAFFTLFSGSLITRVQLSVATMLVLAVFMKMNSGDMPTVSYFTALDHFIFFCASMILGVVTVNFLMYNFHKPNEAKGEDRMRRLNDHEHDGQNGRLLETLYDGSTSVAPELNSKFDEIVYACCAKSKYILPALFLVYNLIYWIVVLSGSSWFPEDFIIVETRDQLMLVMQKGSENGKKLPQKLQKAEKERQTPSSSVAQAGTQRTSNNAVQNNLQSTHPVSAHPGTNEPDTGSRSKRRRRKRRKARYAIRRKNQLSVAQYIQLTMKSENDKLQEPLRKLEAAKKRVYRRSYYGNLVHNRLLIWLKMRQLIPKTSGPTGFRSDTDDSYTTTDESRTPSPSPLSRNVNSRHLMSNPSLNSSSVLRRTVSAPGPVSKPNSLFQNDQKRSKQSRTTSSNHDDAETESNEIVHSTTSEPISQSIVKTASAPISLEQSSRPPAADKRETKATTDEDE